MTTFPKISGGGVLDKKVEGTRRVLDTFILPENIHSVTYVSDEVTSNCPITRQPDWYKVEIYIYNTEVGLESKSLKLYLQSFKNDGQFCEAFADEIARDVRSATRGGGVGVTLTQKPRGGVSIIAIAEVP